MYEPEELEKLFKACDTEERLGYEFFLMIRMREMCHRVSRIFLPNRACPRGIAKTSHLSGKLLLRFGSRISPHRAPVNRCAV